MIGTSPKLGGYTYLSQKMNESTQHPLCPEKQEGGTLQTDGVGESPDAQSHLSTQHLAWRAETKGSHERERGNPEFQEVFMAQVTG